ncbi:MAG: Asp-tRNA(Asn)/Glu-tRNA(Gln) amidotransferase subunit GatB [Candidatus Aenigmarchaeota archaeon]|nr:Asp-tRNA(Asn)/Glu-tRNA(Gln) amidotransferase subunit GatB [Candidatus Aenigmarchaeota archaeon]
MIKIGLEIHCALSCTKTKLFCGCPNRVVGEPNTITCPACLGLPGSKPRVNAAAIEAGIKIGLALNCKFPKEIFFSRKQYFYNDLPKNFQITQYEIPLGKDGFFETQEKRIGITRIHLEEDPGKIIHAGGDMIKADYTLIDYNRSGVPLCEIVTEPDLRSAQEARIFLEELSRVLEYLEVYDSGREGALRVDTNVSSGSERVEVKNISSFRDVEKAIEYEIKRQAKIIEKGSKVVRETRAWNGSQTVSLREKEAEEEYGYIFEPDLTRTAIDEKAVKSLKKTLPEMAADKVKRYQKEFRLSRETAESITSDLHLARMFETVVKDVEPKLAGSWLAVQVPKTLNYNNLRIKDSGLRPEHLIKLLKLVEHEKITEKTAEETLRKIVLNPQDPENLVKDMAKIFDKKELEDAVNEVLASHPKAIIDFKSGKKEALNFLMGQVMRKTKGRGDSATIRDILKKRL